jgi:hypothetical protein
VTEFQIFVLFLTVCLAIAVVMQVVFMYLEDHRP